MSTYVQIPPDSTGKKIYAQDFTVSGSSVYVQGVNIVSHTDPENGQIIDNKGASYIRFSEGEPKLDPYGSLKTSRCVVIGSYDHSSDSQDDLYTIVEEDGGTSNYDVTNSRVTLETTTSATASVIRTTNRYHYYSNRVGILCFFGVQCGDTGKANNVRRWGYFDENNGLFFQLSGTQLSIVDRSNFGGSVVDDVIPQSAWNVDKLDGTGVSLYNLTVTTGQAYWINIQCNSSVRFGVLDSTGVRTVCHAKIRGSSKSILDLSLPVRFENFNVGSTISTTDLHEYNAALFYDNPVDYTFWRFSDLSTSAAKTVTTQTPVLSIRSYTELNGKTNRITTYPQTLAVYVSGGPVKMEILWDSTLSGDTFSLSGQSTLQGDIAATSVIDDNYSFISEMCDTGITNIDLSKYYELNDEGIMVNADGTTQPITTFAFTRLTGTTTTVHATLTYRELR